MKMITIALSSLTMAEKFALSGEMLLRGMGTVFMVLIILFLILKIFGAVFGGTTKEKEKPVAKAETPAPKAEAPAPKTESPAPAAAAASTDDKALVAVITAAIAEYMRAEGKSDLPFRVVSFTRKNNASGWMGNSADNQ